MGMIPIKYRYDLINELITRFHYQRYLEIGLAGATNFTRVKCKHKHSVDPNTSTNPTFGMTSDEFFREYADERDKYNIIFIDGLHHAEQVERDIFNALRRLTPIGTIVLHDCNPTSEYLQVRPPVHGDWCGDVWKAFVKYRYMGEFDAFTLDTDYGLGVIRKGFNKQTSIELPANWDEYATLEANREYMLGLRPPEI